MKALIYKGKEVACNAASCVAARWLKISKIRAVRSQTLTSPPKVFSKLRNCLKKFNTKISSSKSQGEKKRERMENYMGNFHWYELSKGIKPG